VSRIYENIIEQNVKMSIKNLGDVSFARLKQ